MQFVFASLLLGHFNILSFFLNLHVLPCLLVWLVLNLSPIMLQYRDIGWPDSNSDLEIELNVLEEDM